MGNLTLAIDDESLKRARIRALEMGTSVNQLVRGYIEAYADGREAEYRSATLELLRLVDEARAASVGSGPSGRGWTRDELYEERTTPQTRPDA